MLLNNGTVILTVIGLYCFMFDLKRALIIGDLFVIDSCRLQLSLLLLT